MCRLLSSVGWAKVDMTLTNDWLLQWCFQEAYREEQLINRLMRQSQQERRIAVQLMHVRHEKEVLWQNRIFREKQYEERRLKDFQDALDREAVNNTSLNNPSKASFDPFYHVKVNRAAFRCQSFHESVFYMISLLSPCFYFCTAAPVAHIASTYYTVSLQSWFFQYFTLTTSPCVHFSLVFLVVWRSPVDSSTTAHGNTIPWVLVYW